MVNLNMIDTVGSGIKRMFRSQKERFFPMPDYDLSGSKVKAVITGKILDLEYARVLARHPDLTIEEIMVLDKVQKKMDLTDEEINKLKNKKLIEGRKPNFIISEQVALKTKQVGSYLKTKGFDNDYYKKLVYEFIKKSISGVSKNELRDLLLSKLPEILTDKQKETKLSSILTDLKKNKKIENTGSDAKSNWKPL